MHSSGDEIAVPRVPTAVTLLVEALIAIATAGVFIASAFTIDVDATQRIGQVSGLASIGFRFVIGGLLVLGALALAARSRNGAHFDVTWRYACAGIAGLLSGALAAGVVVALHGTPWGFNAERGDVGLLAKWATMASRGEATPPSYPPLPIHVLAWYADVVGIPTAYAIKHLQIIGVGLTAPLGYVAWRLVLRPGWALSIGGVTILPLFELYKPYPNLILILFVPVLIKFIEVLRTSGASTPRRSLAQGIASGATFGVLALFYPGWFQWSAVGVVVLVLATFPWRTGRRNAVIFCGAAGLVFALVVAHYVLGVVADAHGIKDNFFYFDVYTDPWYVAMWRNDLPGDVTAWPPAGELGGIGLFSVLLFAGAGAAIAYGRERSSVLVVSALLASCWLLRFWYARQMWDTKLVQLYPRTSAEILYCLLIACGLAAYYGLGARLERETSPARHLGLATALLLLFGASSSSIVNRYMPKDDVRDLGNLAWVAHKTPRYTANQARDASIEASTSLEDGGWSKMAVIDRNPRSSYSSLIRTAADAEEWIELRLPAVRSFSKLVYRTADDGVPAELIVEVWDGERWLVRAVAAIRGGPNAVGTVQWGRTDETDRVRLRAPKLGPVTGGFALRLAEISLHR